MDNSGILPTESRADALGKPVDQMEFVELRFAAYEDLTLDMDNEKLADVILESAIKYVEQRQHDVSLAVAEILA